MPTDVQDWPQTYYVIFVTYLCDLSFDMGIIFSLTETASEKLVFSLPPHFIKGLKSRVDEKELLWLLITVA